MTRALARRIGAMVLAAVLAASPHVSGGRIDAAEPGMTVDVSWTRPGSSTVLRHPSAVRVGDTMTIAIATTGVERVECSAGITAFPLEVAMGIQQAGADTCLPWTFVVPPVSPLGTLEVAANVFGYRDADDVDGVALEPFLTTVSMESGGIRQPYTSNFPSASWAPIDFLGANQAQFGVPLTFAAPTGATRGCAYRIQGDWNNHLEVRPADYDTCPSWEVTVPELRPEPFRAGLLASPMDSIFQIESSTIDAGTGVWMVATMSTKLRWSATAGSGAFASNLPAALWPEATTPRYAYPNQPINLVPALRSVPDGAECRIAVRTPDMVGDDFDEYVQPVSGGTCPGLTVASPVTGVFGAQIQVFLSGEPLTWTDVRVEIIDPIPSPTVTAPPSVVEGDPLSVIGSVSSGVPMGYSISLAPAATATSEPLGLTAATSTCAQGALDPRLAQTSASATCTAENVGSYRLAVRFTDVTGTTRTTTRTVNVVDVVTRLAGADRYSTAATVSARSFSPGVPVAYVAVGTAFPDALAAGPVAARDRGPVLLVKGSSVPTATMNELKRLKPKKIVVLGGTSVVGQPVLTALATVAPVSRVAGIDRYETAAKLSRTFAAGVPVAYVAVGTNFPDALAGVPATRGRGPLLLVSPTRIPASVASELARLKPQQIVVLGGTSVISPAVVAALDRYTTGSVTRRSGANRYETAVKVSASAFGSASVAYLGVGTNFPDALAGGPPAAIAGAPLLLVTRDSVPTIVRNELARLGVTRVVLLGGTGTISASVEAQLESLLD